MDLYKYSQIDLIALFPKGLKNQPSSFKFKKWYVNSIKAGWSKFNNCSWRFNRIRSIGTFFIYFILLLLFYYFLCMYLLACNNIVPVFVLEKNPLRKLNALSFSAQTSRLPFLEILVTYKHLWSIFTTIRLWSKCNWLLL